jgi:putative Ca2+/H+ antiporter (TMEM165/GDT1 family)
MITYYLSVVFLSIGTSHFLALLLSGVNCTTFFITAFVPILLIDRVGRKPLLIYGSIGMTCTMVMLAGMLSHPGNATGIVAILSIFLYQAFYSTGGWMATPVSNAMGKTLTMSETLADPSAHYF